MSDPFDLSLTTFMKLKKNLVLAALLSVILLIGGYTGYHGYKSARQHRLVKQARMFLEKSNHRKALLSLERVLKYTPRDVEACRLMAELAEMSRSPSALLWRSKVIDLNPHSTEDRFALAQTALMLHDYASATNALEGVDPADKKKGAFHNIAGMAASAINRLPEAEAHFIEARRLEPQNLVPQMNLAVVRLHSTNAAALAEARTTLKTLSGNASNSLIRCQAVRELAVDAIRYHQTNAALALTRDLLAQTNSTFRDRILRLEVLRDTHDPEFKSTLPVFQREAAGDPGKIYELAMWQLGKTSPSETLGWLTTLPQSTQTNQPVSLLITDCYALLKDWRGLQAYLEPQRWGELEFIRHAFEARALKGQGLTGAATGEWELALKGANGQKQPLAMLFRLAAQWNWMTEAEDLLWSIVNRYPDEKWAYQSLSQALFAGGRTRPLMQLYSLGMKRAPTDLETKNNL